MATPPFTLPGFTEPLNFIHYPDEVEFEYDDATGKRKLVVTPASGSERAVFSTALYQFDFETESQGRARLDLTTLREFAMLRFMNEITDKAQWNVKIMDDTIADKWKKEAQQQGDFTESMATYCIDELRWRAKVFEETGFVFVFDGDVVKSDSAVSIDLKERLQVAVGKLEAVESKLKDYHPYSHDKVWNLVHPSLFPLVYGTSRILREVIGLTDCLDKMGLGEILPVSPPLPAYIKHEYYSRKFQWLPCDVRVAAADETKSSATKLTADGVAGGVKCTIASYINNLHPHRHGDLYTVLEEIMTAAVPLWNETLLANEDRSRRLRIPYHQVDYDGDPNSLVDAPASDIYDADADKAYWEALQAARLKCIIYPEPEPFQVPPETKSDSEGMRPGMKTLPFIERFAADGLQVIVKLATIELTPEKPTYDGGVWHVEGQLNEHICATALYYYSCDNITESRLGFRHLCESGSLDQFDEALQYEQNDSTFLEAIFGCKDRAPSFQDVGSVVCKEGRLITFPNILLHRVLPFQLADPTKPGHRKMLALFLVDPNLHIISTSSVPPQRMDWWRNEVRADDWQARLTKDAQDGIATMLGFPLSMENAKLLRLELMEERKELEQRHAKELEAVTFSLCEH